MNHWKEKKQDDDKKKTNVYTGGEKRFNYFLICNFIVNSGLAVENPDDIHGILSKAEQWDSFLFMLITNILN